MDPSGVDMKKYKISFCTSCTKRLHHIKETFISNLENNIDYGDIEFVLLNWNSQDGMNEWVQQNLKGYIDDGVVKYLHTKPSGRRTPRQDKKTESV